MRRIKLTVSYDGTNYCGWQLQPGKQTIEAELNRALSELLKEEVVVTGASRTDSGVHALGNVAVFDTGHPIPAEKVCYAVNQYLPEDIRVQASEEVSPEFHPRRVACRKTYEYHILNRRVALPKERLYSTHIYYELDADRMRRGVDYLVGEHDFKSFCSVKTQARETVRTIYRADVSREGEHITITVTGNGFLYNMVRIIAGTLIEIGRGACPPEWVKQALEGRDRGLAGPTAPPEGLTLVKIEYE